MTAGLNPSDVVNVQLTMSPVAIPNANFGGLLVIGTSTAITPGERLRLYTGIAGVANDFAATTPEYAAAAAFFGQSPQPTVLYIGVQATGETPVQALEACYQASGAWYGAMFADTAPTLTDHYSCAAFIEATGNKLYGVTTNDIGAIDPASTADEAYLLSQLGYKRVVTQFSLSSPVAIASLFGRAFTTDFTANNSTITLKFKQEPGIVPEVLSETQAAALAAKNCNVFVQYNNGAAFIQNGTMSNGYFFDEVHGGDWITNALQVAVFNLLYTSPTKVPQTDEGTEMIETVAAGVMTQARRNGLIAPGVWTSVQEFGSLKTGQTLTSGFYIYAPPIALQLQADREARKSVPIQIAMKLAGAVHTANLIVSVNR